jgi:hypothetical protein
MIGEVKGPPKTLKIDSLGRLGTGPKLEAQQASILLLHILAFLSLYFLVSIRLRCFFVTLFRPRRPSARPGRAPEQPAPQAVFGI